MNHWEELKTAYKVARLGTVSAAADQLGVHRATVVRHIDALEAAMGGKLFLRHRGGYVPTEAGEDLLRVARAAEEQFEQLAGRTRGRSADVDGEIIVTSVAVFAPLVLHALTGFHERHPRARVRFEASARLYQLEYGEAHVAVRIGSQPEHPDNVVRPWRTVRSGLYAHRSYVDRRGLPSSVGDFVHHAFVTDAAPGRPGTTEAWLASLAPDARIAFSSVDERVAMAAVHAGLGIGFLPEWIALNEPGLVEVLSPRPAWDTPMWLVTHVDQHRTAKVQAILGFLADQGG